jgi:chromosome segregation ATPase
MFHSVYVFHTNHNQNATVAQNPFVDVGAAITWFQQCTHHMSTVVLKNMETMRNELALARQYCETVSQDHQKILQEYDVALQRAEHAEQDHQRISQECDEALQRVEEMEKQALENEDRINQLEEDLRRATTRRSRRRKQVSSN